jgi:Holliday junction resolvase
MPLDDKKKAMPADGARLIQDVLAKLGWPADAATVADEVRRLDIGLPLEDEFSVLCAWLGKCQLLHKLDQQQLPIASRKEFQVPDLLAKFSTQINKSPVLIEVKSKKDKFLSFKPDYLQHLQNYADLMGMPLLIAWKFHRLWLLFEVRHMKKATKNFNITLETACRENLLGTKKTEAGIMQQWMATIDDVTFTDFEGCRRMDLDGEVQSLFTAWDLNEKEEHTDTHIHLRCVAGEEGIQFAHTALVHLLNWESPHNDSPHWRGLLRKAQVTTNAANFSATLVTALRQKVVHHILHLKPHTMPDFLPPR